MREPKSLQKSFKSFHPPVGSVRDEVGALGMHADVFALSPVKPTTALDTVAQSSIAVHSISMSRPSMASPVIPTIVWGGSSAPPVTE
jgi:hypothetical protein